MDNPERQSIDSSTGEFLKQQRSLSTAGIDATWWINPTANPDCGKVEPPDPVAGLLAYADGVNWNPGSTGAGLYMWSGTAWVKAYFGALPDPPADSPTTQNALVGSRSLGSTYQNTTGKPLWVNVMCSSSVLGATKFAYSDASATPTVAVARIDQSRVGDIQTLSFIVIPDNYYKIVISSGGSLYQWIEWY